MNLTAYRVRAEQELTWNGRVWARPGDYIIINVDSNAAHFLATQRHKLDLMDLETARGKSVPLPWGQS